MDVQLTLSTCEECVDEMGRLVPPGNYYFKVTRMYPRMVSGTLYQRGEFGRFTFSYEQMLKMVSVAQARLARRANISSPHMPSHASPQRPNTTVSTTPRSPLRQRRRRHQSPPPASLTCSICYEAIPAVELKTLGCNHPFHTACINTWLRRKRNCPLCRRTVPRESSRLPRITQPPMRFRQDPEPSVATTRRPQNPDDRVVTPPLRVRNLTLQAYRQRYGGYAH